MPERLNDKTIHFLIYLFTHLFIINLPYRGRGWKFEMGRQIFIDDHMSWYQHAKHATLGGFGGMPPPPPGNFWKIGLLRLNLREFSPATLLCGIPLGLEVLKPSSQLVGCSTAPCSTKPSAVLWLDSSEISWFLSFDSIANRCLTDHWRLESEVPVV